jgi:hypothetical protein
MATYDFKLIFTLPHGASAPEQYLKSLATQGCDDATVGIGMPGRIALQFSRDANSAEVAMLSALRDVGSAIPGAKLAEAAPDLVGLTDMANLLDCSRQNMRKLLMTNVRSFPAPVHHGTTPIWHLALVLDWLQESKTRLVEQKLVQTAHVAMQLNLVKESTLLDKTMQGRLSRLVPFRHRPSTFSRDFLKDGRQQPAQQKRKGLD